MTYNEHVTQFGKAVEALMLGDISDLLAEKLQAEDLAALVETLTQEVETNRLAVLKAEVDHEANERRAGGAA